MVPAGKVSTGMKWVVWCQEWWCCPGKANEIWLCWIWPECVIAAPAEFVVFSKFSWLNVTRITQVWVLTGLVWFVVLSSLVTIFVGTYFSHGFGVYSCIFGVYPNAVVSQALHKWSIPIKYSTLHDSVMETNVPILLIIALHNFQPGLPWSTMLTYHAYLLQAVATEIVQVS